MDSELLHAAATLATAYGNGLRTRPVQPRDIDLARLGTFDEPLPERSTTAGSVLARLDAVGSPATVASTGGRYFGYVTGGALPVAVAAHWLATAWDQNTTYATAAPATVAIERVALRWVAELLGIGPDAAGAFVTGATMANFCALAAARHALLARAGWHVESDGMFGAPPIEVVVSAEVHASVIKALGLLGFGRARVTRVPTDAQGRMRLDAVPPFGPLTLVCAQAGNVNTGAFDPLAELARMTRPAGGWLHVDGAFGLWAHASERTRHLCDGVAEADSWATDCHKWLNVPYDSGLVLVRDRAALRAAMSVSADYLPESGAGAHPTANPAAHPSDHTPELSRRARGVDAWAALQHLGRSGVEALVDRCCAHARRFAAGLRAAGHTVLNDVVLNQVLVDFGDAALTDRIVRAIQADGTCWCGRTVFQGRTAMRMSVSSWATTEADVETSLAAILRIACLHCGAERSGHTSDRDTKEHP